ncbi:hypothetical protein CAPTEDRAFT_214696 [Capitella teleta]|uniref:Uncharacterized protein n=1 Tax=Capitella teleta TaxID=283909 RepID=R7UVH6_CAPTE|nr:hypothetical protein CAPTEDRAFT_214696 [Capitella teleta]|eukprot:ELU10247.1 hypothetical protein CAPTEDRAFT_214696 [Capitella teleta]
MANAITWKRKLEKHITSECDGIAEKQRKSRKCTPQAKNAVSSFAKLKRKHSSADARKCGKVPSNAVIATTEIGFSLYRAGSAKGRTFPSKIICMTEVSSAMMKVAL